MGFGSYGNLVEMALGLSGFETPGIRTSDPQVITSLIGGSSHNSIDGYLTDAEAYFYNDSMLTLLRDWELTQAILDVFVSTLGELVVNSSLQVTGSNYDDELNRFIDKIDLKHIILNNLPDALYFGQYGFYIDYNNERLLDLINPLDLVLVKDITQNTDKYLLLNSDTGIGALTEDLRDRYINYPEIGLLAFNIKTITTGLADANVLDPEDVEGLKSRISKITYYKGTSIMKRYLYLIFIHFLKSLLQLLLTLKNATRPDIIQAMVQKERVPEKLITEGIEAIESLLNNGDYSFDLRANNVASIISTLYNSVLNSVKVVPGLNNYTNLELIQLPPISEKIEQLSNDIDKARQQAIQSSGIPEELLGGGGNRWEVISRNSRFQSVIRFLLDGIVNCVRETAVKYIMVRHNKIQQISSLNVAIDTNNFMNSNSFNNRIQVLTEGMAKVNELLESGQRMIDSEFVDRTKLFNYIKDNLSGVDERLAELLKIPPKKSSEDGPTRGGGMGWG